MIERAYAAEAARAAETTRAVDGFLTDKGRKINGKLTKLGLVLTVAGVAILFTPFVPVVLGAAGVSIWFGSSMFTGGLVTGLIDIVSKRRKK